MTSEGNSFVVKFHDHGGAVNAINDNVDVFVYFDNGLKYVATFFTMENIQQILKKDRMTGEARGGKYFWAENMILVERLEETTIYEAVADLIESGDFAKAFDGPHPID